MTCVRVFPVRVVRCATLAVFACQAVTGVVLGQTFTDVTAQSGIDFVHYVPENIESGIVNKLMSGGAAAGDVDRDGWTDLYVTRLDGSDILFRNLGMGDTSHLGFQDVTQQWIPSTPTRSNGAAFGDVDNDGDLDLYVTATKDTRHFLYLNDGAGRFHEAAEERGAAVANADVHVGNGIAFGDYDRDGFLDIYTTEWRNNPCKLNPSFHASNTRLLRNVGATSPGSFQDVTDAAGVSIDHVAPAVLGRTFEGTAFAFAPRFSDLDADGYADLLLTSDFGTSRLFWNNGDGTFTDGTLAANVGSDRNGMGSTVGDFDGDGMLDWFVTAIDTEQGNRLYRNEGNRTFSEKSHETGVNQAGWGWGASFLDYDNDGDQDIIMTNGFNNGRVPDDRTTLFRNDGGTFIDVSDSEGITDIDQGRGLLTLDYDNNGHHDVFIVNNAGQPILYRNNGSDNYWLRISTTGTSSNRDGIGARITVIPDATNPDHVLVQEIDGGSNYLGHNEMIAHFGLGPNNGSLIDIVRIEWPSSVVQELHDVDPNQLLSVVEPPLVGPPIKPINLPDDVPNHHENRDPAEIGRPFRVLPGGEELIVEYDPKTGQVAFEGPDWHTYVGIEMQIRSSDGQPADFEFVLGETGWENRDVFSFVDEPTRLEFQSRVRCQGTYTMRGGATIDVLPPGLSREQLADLSISYELSGIPVTYYAQVIVVPEPSSVLSLAVAGLCLAFTCKTNRCRTNKNRIAKMRYFKTRSEDHNTFVSSLAHRVSVLNRSRLSNLRPHRTGVFADGPSGNGRDRVLAGLLLYVPEEDIHSHLSHLS